MWRSSLVASVATLVLLPPVWGGSYSSGSGASSAKDAGIPGFVGPDGAGIVSSANSVNPLFQEWASTVANYSPAPGVDSIWLDSSVVVGPVSGIYSDVASLGDLSPAQIAGGVSPGSIVVGFTRGIRNGDGADFAVYENALGGGASVFAELAYVEVSSDGTNFVRFPSISDTPGPFTGPLAAYQYLDPTNVYNLAGKHANGNGKSWGTPFDLSDLADDPLVVSGTVDLASIRYVRFVDVPGTGAYLDSRNLPIYDPTLTTGSGGFDLQAVGVINVVPEPSMAALLAAPLALTRRRRSRR